MNQTVWGATRNGTYFFIIKNYRRSVHNQLLRSMGIKIAAYNDRTGRARCLRKIRRLGIHVVKLMLTPA